MSATILFNQIKMEIKDARHIEIIHTLEKIERLNGDIHFHKAKEEKVDDLAIEQYERMKAQLTEQLIGLLAGFDLNLEVANP